MDTSLMMEAREVFKMSTSEKKVPAAIRAGV
jgi:hypothetical protein